MLVGFFDEFGHCGPFINRFDPKHNTSPVFGLAGYVLPHSQVRHFATFFYQLKGNLLARDIAACGVHPATWEKKGSELIRTKNIRKYRTVRSALHRILNEIARCNGKIVYYGRQKYQSAEESNSQGLYKTVLSHTIRGVDRYAEHINAHFMMILDQHQDRIKLLEAAPRLCLAKLQPGG